MKKFQFVFRVLLAILTIIVTIVFFALIGMMQEKIFVPEDYIMWIFKYPFSRLVFIFEFFFAFGIFFVLNKEFRQSLKKKTIYKKHGKSLFYGFTVLLVLLLYVLITNVTVITAKKIIDYSYLVPKGRQYAYHDVVKINAGVYGRNFLHSKGDFYYIIQLKNGEKIDLAEMGGAKNDVDPRFIIEKLDRKFVEIGIPKTASMANFQYATQHLDKIYTDKIKKILTNTK